MKKEKKFSFVLLVVYFIVEIVLTLISTMNEILLILSMIFYWIILINGISVNHYYSSLINVFFHYLMFTLSYAEILPWETAIVILLFLLILYYNYKLNSLSKTENMFDQFDEEVDLYVKRIVFKCQISHLMFYIYTLHLCLTTICTPEMYFNWFLIIRNCQYTYSSI